MSGGGASYPTSTLAGLWTGANQAFQPVPYPNTGAAAGRAYDLSTGGWSTGAGGWTPWSQGNTGASFMNNAGTLSGLGGPLASGAANSLNNLPLINQTGMGFLNRSMTAGRGPMNAGWSQYNTLSPYVSQLLTAGFDPQKQLYNREFNLQQQQALANNAASGVATTPYGAGMVNQGNQNFNIDWQNNLLQREALAAQAAGGLSNAAMGSLGQGFSTGLNAANTTAGIGAELLGAGGNLLGQGGNLYGTGANVASTGANLGQGGAGFLNNLNQQQIQDLLAYLSASTQNASAWGGMTNNALSGANNLYGQQLYGQNLNNVLNSGAFGGLGSLLGTGLGYYLQQRPSQ